MIMNVDLSGSQYHPRCAVLIRECFYMQFIAMQRPIESSPFIFHEAVNQVACLHRYSIITLVCKKAATLAA